MTPGLNFARASCAAERSEGSASASARSSRHAASREIGFAPSLANSAAADSASGEKVAIRRYFEIRFIEIQRKQRSYRQIILANHTGKDHNGHSESLSLRGRLYDLW